MLQALVLVLTLSGVPSTPNHAASPAPKVEVKDPKPPTPERLLGCDDEYAWRAVSCRWIK